MRRRHLIAGAVTGLVVVLIAAGPVTLINDLTRVDAGEHVSNISCGAGSSCPAGMECWSDFEADRIGAEIEGGRCVTPAYVSGYCGLFAAAYTVETDPPAMFGCQRMSLREIGAGIITEPRATMAGLRRLFQAWFSPGVEGLGRDNITTARQDPTGGPVRPPQRIDCEYAGLEIFNLTRGSDDSVTLRLANTGTVDLRNITARTTYYDTTIDDRTIEWLDTGDTHNITLEADGADTVSVTPGNCPAHQVIVSLLD